MSREVRLTLAGRPLPDDIPAAALALWQAGRHAEALGLLYRGAIARAHERFDLRLPLGATEGEALRAIAPEIEPLAEGFRPLRSHRPGHSLVEHITASGRFLWQHGASGALIAATVDALRQRIRARHPAWAGLPVTDLSVKLAAFTGLPEPAIARALAADPPSSGERFARDIETLESVRRRL